MLLWLHCISSVIFFNAALERSATFPRSSKLWPCILRSKLSALKHAFVRLTIMFAMLSLSPSLSFRSEAVNEPWSDFFTFQYRFPGFIYLLHDIFIFFVLITWRVLSHGTRWELMCSIVLPAPLKLYQDEQRNIKLVFSITSTDRPPVSRILGGKI